MFGPGRNSYRRLTGTLRLYEHSAVLEAADGSLIYLDTSDQLADFDGRDVVAEGQMSGSDRMSLTWLGPVGD
jgi:hypothetical protein